MQKVEGSNPFSRFNESPSPAGFSVSLVGADGEGQVWSATRVLFSDPEFEIAGYPPAKGEAFSMLGSKHSHAPHVKALLEAARAAAEDGAESLRGVPIGMEVVVRCRRTVRRPE
jgi:hypothetical protein